MKFVKSTEVIAGTKVWSAPLRVLRVPFSQNASETDTGIRFMKGDIIEDVRILVVTNVAASTIDVGLNGTTHDDPDGLVDGASCAAAGWPMVSDSGASASVMGGMLQEGADGQATVAAATGGPSRLLIREDNVPLTYTTSAHAIAGYIIVLYRSLDDGANYAS